MLPIMVFMGFYKSLWLLVVAYPLWKAGTLAGSTAEEMARVFAWMPVMIVIVPWKSFVRQHVLPGKRQSVRGDRVPSLQHQPAARG